MIEALSGRIARKIRAMAPEEETTTGILQYAISIKLTYFFTFIFTAAIGYLLGHCVESLIAMISFMVLRNQSGGFHMRTLTQCVVFSSFVFIMIPLVPLHDRVYPFLFLLTLVMVWIYAPSIKEESNICKDSFRRRKMVSVVLVLVSCFIQVDAVHISLFVQALTLFPYGRR